VRGLVALTALVATFLCTNPIVLFVCWLFLMLPVAYRVKILAKHLLFCAAVVAPMAVGLLLVWGVLVGAPPSSAPHSNPAGGFEYATLVVSRLLVSTALLQIIFLSLSMTELAQTIYGLGLRGEMFFMVLGALAVLPEIRLRAAQIHDACKARGLLGRQSFLQRIQVYPYILRGVFAWTLRSAQQRSETWNGRGILEDHGQWSWKGERSFGLEALLLCVVGGYLVLSIYIRCMP
jgi:energy-coupling factor transporter transmembrane protein EcfT